MAHIIIDRRKNDKGRSSVNRKKFIERIKQYAKDSVRDAVAEIDITDVNKGGKQIRIPIRNLDEPTFHHAQGGINDLVVTGNDKFVVGDKIKRPDDEDDGQGEGGQDGDGEDEFAFTLTKDEFLDIFYENCELPFMTKKMLISLEEEIQRAGFRNDGPPAALNIVRSARKATGRRAAMKSAKKKKIKELEEELKALEEELSLCTIDSDRTKELRILIDKTKLLLHDVKARLKKVRFIDPVDLQFNAWSTVPVPSIQAVMFCILDVSASMDEYKKQLAKTFFMLLYLFLERNYQRVVIEFIRHHNIAESVSEEDFFYAKDSGGTIVSSALELMIKKIEELYSPACWSVYVAQGTDGDNFPEDMEHTKELLVNKVLPIVQYYAYAQIQDEDESEPASPSYYRENYNMWMMMNQLAVQHPNLGTGLITHPRKVYPIFKKLFEKRDK